MLTGSSIQTMNGYSLTMVKNILNIAPQFINMRKNNIFILTANSATSALLEILRDESIWQSHDSVARIQSAIEKHHNGIEEAKAERERLNDLLDSRSANDIINKDERKRIENDLEKIDSLCCSIGDYEWAVVCKLAMKDGNILNQTPETQNAMNIFVEQMQKIYEVISSEMFQKGASFLRIEAQDFIIQFIGQLCALGQIESASVIHQYLYLSHLVLRERAVNDVDVLKIGMVLTPGIMEGLQLYRHILPRNGEVNSLEADRQEYALFKKIIPSFIQAPIFHQPFKPELYDGIHQPTFSKNSEELPPEEIGRQGLMTKIFKLPSMLPSYSTRTQKPTPPTPRNAISSCANGGKGGRSAPS